MKLFEIYLREYLTPAQRERYKTVQVKKDARAATDHFFGVGNDVVRRDVPSAASTEKGEVHLAIEKAIGQEISIEDYRRGTVKDRYNRDVKIGRLIKDEKLRNQFASDPARQGTRKSGYYATIHRGTEVAGQTNSAADETHPQGHSWGGQSCKNIDSGINRQYLVHEIQAGTVVVFIHEPSGKEIYRATLQPYLLDKSTDDYSVVGYHIDAEYGVINSEFQSFSKQIAEEISTPNHTGKSLLQVARNVYSNSGVQRRLHPSVKISAEDIIDVLSKNPGDEISESIETIIRTYTRSISDSEINTVLEWVYAHAKTHYIACLRFITYTDTRTFNNVIAITRRLLESGGQDIADWYLLRAIDHCVSLKIDMDFYAAWDMALKHNLKHVLREASLIMRGDPSLTSDVMHYYAQHNMPSFIEIALREYNNIPNQFRDLLHRELKSMSQDDNAKIPGWYLRPTCEHLPKELLVDIIRGKNSHMAHIVMNSARASSLIQDDFSLLDRLGMYDAVIRGERVFPNGFPLDFVKYLASHPEVKRKRRDRDANPGAIEGDDDTDIYYILRNCFGLVLATAMRIFAPFLRENGSLCERMAYRIEDAKSIAVFVDILLDQGESRIITDFEVFNALANILKYNEHMFTEELISKMLSYLQNSSRADKKPIRHILPNLLDSMRSVTKITKVHEKRLMKSLGADNEAS